MTTQGPRSPVAPLHEVLPDGDVLRDATPDDLDAIVALLDDRMGDEVADEAIAAVDELGLGDWVVVERAAEVVATSTLLSETWELAGTSLAVGMPDFVATARDDEGRGLFRAQIDVHHRRSEERGDALQAIIGIPYYYRRFGYSYPLDTQHDLAVAEPWPPAPTDTTVRPLTPADLPAVEALQTATLAAADLRMRHSPSTWRCMAAVDHLDLVVAEDAADIVGAARLYRDDAEVHVLDLAGTSEGIDALLHHARTIGEVRVQRRPDPTILERLRDEPTRKHAAVFVRVPDLVRILDLLRPLLSERLAAAGIDEVPTSVVVSRYGDAAALEIRDRTVTAVRPAAGVRYGTPGVLRVPPDEVPALLFGPIGASGLEQQHPDVLLGELRDVADVLFPPVAADLLTWVPPY